ncbi:MAG: hypothetical protein WD101_04970 [Gemmatimonadota bacterium]
MPYLSVFVSVLAVCVLGLASAGGALAQEPGELAARCALGGGDADRCANAEVAARALVGQTGLLTGLGSELPGSSSTLGTKLGSSPRLSTSLRLGAMSVGLPDLFDEGLGTAGDASFLVPSVHASLGVGLFDGFSPMATVGGVLSLDVFGSVAFVMPPSSQGFKGSATGATLGARLGVLRESFTLPGVSVSASRRFGGEVELGSTELGDPASVIVDPAVTSLRITVGKDLLGVGVLAGWGWDDASTDAVLAVAGFGPEPATVTGPVDVSRSLYFGGLSMNFLLLQLSLEGGWAEGYPDLPGGSPSSFDPGSGSAFASVALRFTP